MKIPAGLLKLAKPAFFSSLTVVIAVVVVFLAVFETRVFATSCLVYAVVGLFTESLFTGLNVQFDRGQRGLPIDWKLPCKPFLWSIPVFGLSPAISLCALDVFSPAYFGIVWWLRGILTLVGIYAWEYYWGWRIEKWTRRCPWAYRQSPWAVWRYVNPWYAGFWFGFGFMLVWLYRRVIPLLAPLMPAPERLLPLP